MKGFKTIFFALGAIHLLLLTHAQSPKIDYLKNQLLSRPDYSNFNLEDTSYLANLWYLCAEFYSVGQSDSMNKYAKEGLLLAQNFKRVNADKTKQLILSNYEMVFYKNLGISFFDSGDYTSQLKYFHEYLKKAEEINSIRDIGTAYSYMAMCHRELEDYDKAYDFAKKAYAILKDTEYKTAIGSALSIFSSYYFDGKENYDSSYYYRKKVIALYKEANHVPLLINSYLDLIEFFQYYRKWDSCRYYLSEAEPLVDQTQNPDQVMPFNSYKANLMLVEGKSKEAIELLLNTRKTALQTEVKEDDYNINKYLALAYAADGKITEAFTCIDSAFNAYSDDVNLNKARSLTKAQMNFDFEKERTRAAEENKREKLIRNFSIAGSILILLLALFIFQRYRERHKSSLLLAEKNKSIEKAYTDLKSTQNELVETEKQREVQSVRVRIARDIHDEIGSSLTKITMLSDSIKKNSNLNGQEESLNKIATYSKNVSEALNEIVWAINPGHDTAASLINYMKSAAHNLLDDSNLNYKLEFPEDDEQIIIHPEVKRNIYLVMKEAINNALKYACAKNINVAFNIQNNHFNLLIEDDGNGFDPEQGNDSGNGLTNMRARIEQDANQFSIISAPGKGCKIKVSGSLN